MMAAEALRLDGRLAVVTGAASGIGRCTAAHLKAAGARLLLIDRMTDALATAAAELGAASLPLDLTCWDIAPAFQAALGGEAPDILVNAAGLFPSCPTLDLTEQAWDRVVDVNLKGAVRMAQLAAAAMRGAGGGAIVNVGSIQGSRPSAGKIAYAASKAGLAAATQVMAREFTEFGIRVNAVAPGPMLTGATAEAIAVAGVEAPEGIGDTDEIARVIHFLASPAASYVNGAIWTVDGGAVLAR
ncbi:SDR family NAD(P)-dependent oxidoreductase [Sphingomonas jatrophae]|uniref:Gluconate 5-dehydrogenase n=1 Tax=Sphingomonas jatrophae TaxID=1166337 RepID=A0A1I6M547_9SPHN|nr:SDR family oxidoreductase [Sphingomonas jatrophae]SFS10810.1 gluconate 5-dehydrogenase [Sphingomonas jatrophae]